MDYKTNLLPTHFEATEVLFQEISALKFGTMPDETVLFDYTAYFEELKLEYIDYKVFMRSNKKAIELLAKEFNVDTTNLFYQNTDGHILVSAILTFVFLTFADDRMFLYINRLLSDIFAEGIAFTSSYIMNLADQRLSDYALNLLINERNKNSEGNN